MSGTVASTTPYSWPYDGRLDPRRLALLVVVVPGPEDAEAAADGAGSPDSALGRVGVLAGTMFAVGGV
jgi:hypothetical protein